MLAGASPSTYWCIDEHRMGEALTGIKSRRLPSHNRARSFGRLPLVLLKSRDVWIKALKQLRAGMMPPAGELRPDVEQLHRIEDSIKAAMLRCGQVQFKST